MPILLLCLLGGLLAASEPAASGWPLDLEVQDRPVTVFAPEIERVDGTRLEARAAVMADGGGPDRPERGTVGLVWFVGRIEVGAAAELATLRSLRVTRSHWPDQRPVDDAALSSALAAAVERDPPTWSLDALARAAAAAERQRADATALADAPARIIVRERATLLLRYDGPPRLGPADEGGLRRAINTASLVVRDPVTVSYWFGVDGRWFRATAATGPFAPADDVPAPIRALEPETGSPDPAERAREVVVASAPTDVVWTDGPPRWVPLPGTDLLYVANTPRHILRDIPSGRAYLLASGRWYSATGLQSSWSMVPADRLPVAFARIPADGPLGAVLAHIPGTPAAEEAMRDSLLPRIATVDPATVRVPEVVYDGSPRFAPIAGTRLRRATNTGHAVIASDGRYFCCWDGVWYQATAARGPWSVAFAAPAGIHAIPAGSPLHHVRYVRVYRSTPSVIQVGYLPGYLGCYPSHGTVAWGRGWRAHGWRPHAYGPKAGALDPRADAGWGRWHGRRGSPASHPIEPIYSRRGDVHPYGIAGIRGGVPGSAISGSSAGMAPTGQGWDARGGWSERGWPPDGAGGWAWDDHRSRGDGGSGLGSRRLRTPAEIRARPHADTGWGSQPAPALRLPSTGWSYADHAHHGWHHHHRGTASGLGTRRLRTPAEIRARPHEDRGWSSPPASAALAPPPATDHVYRPRVHLPMPTQRASPLFQDGNHRLRQLPSTRPTIGAGGGGHRTYRGSPLIGNGAYGHGRHPRHAPGWSHAPIGGGNHGRVGGGIRSIGGGRAIGAGGDCGPRGHR